jgi:hypothetical protein
MDADTREKTMLTVAVLLMVIASIGWALHANAVRDREQAPARARCEAIHDLWDRHNAVCLQVIRP